MRYDADRYSSASSQHTRCDGSHTSGGIAQLGERLHGMQEVSGSIPLISTTSFFPDIVVPFRPHPSHCFCGLYFRYPALPISPEPAL